MAFENLVVLACAKAAQAGDQGTLKPSSMSFMLCFCGAAYYIGGHDEDPPKN